MWCFFLFVSITDVFISLNAPEFNLKDFYDNVCNQTLIILLSGLTEWYCIICAFIRGMHNFSHFIGHVGKKNSVALSPRANYTD
jgi:hypothetical protein